MKNKNVRKLVSLCALLVMIALALTGCANQSNDYSVKIAMVMPRVLESAQTTFDTDIRAALPESQTDGKKMLVQYVSTGDVSADAMTAAAATQRVMMMFAANEVEIMICDGDNAFRHGENGATYLKLDKLFTEEEQQQLGIKPLTIAKLDDLGNLTGEQSAKCGIDLSENEMMRSTFKMSNLGLYVIDDGENANLENIKTVIRYILAN